MHAGSSYAPIPGEAAPPALARTLLRILDTLEAQLPEVRRGRDPEALHALRIAVRQTRALAGQFKTQFDPARIAAGREAFDALSDVTGPVRDLDVSLQRWSGYERQFPTVEPAAWAPLRDELARERRAGRRALLRHIRSLNFQASMAEWRAYLTSVEAGASGPPIEGVVSRRIRKLYRRLILQGREALKSGHCDT